MVATSLWPMINGFEPPPKVKYSQESLDRAEQMMRGAEICHGATWVLASAIAVLYSAIGRSSVAAWILLFNLLLNGYPVMLQRANRWRIQQLRAGGSRVEERA
jgi:hypothetical protein